MAGAPASLPVHEVHVVGQLAHSQVQAGRNGMRLKRLCGLPVAEGRDVFCGAMEKQNDVCPHLWVSFYNHNHKLLNIFLPKRKFCISLYLC